MADIAMRPAPPQSTHSAPPRRAVFESKRDKILARVREATVPQTIRVEPANDMMRELLRHPTAGGFRSTGAAAWPDDQFTHRRLKDGGIRKADDQRTTK
jgi:hypothetical protein